jgi:putative aldouronate transport system permease protein
MAGNWGKSLERSKSITLRNAYKHRFLYVMFLPIAGYFIVFHYIPLVMGIVISFQDFRIGNSLFTAKFAGFANYANIFKNKEILQSIRNTLMISLLKLLFGFLPPIILAICLFDIRSFLYKRVAQTIVYIPHFFSWVIVYGIFWVFFSTGSGLINYMVEKIIGHRINFFMTPGWFLFLIIFSSIWKSVGWGSILYMAALTSVNIELFEAAKLDGCGPFKRVWYVTLPSIMPIIGFVLTISIGSILGSDFEQILMFYNTQVYNVGDVIPTWVYREGLSRFKYSLGSAVGMLNGIVGVFLIVLGNKLSRKLSGRGMW